MPQPDASEVPSPCRQVCVVRRGICTGCGRTLDEIAAWPFARDDERALIAERAAARILR